MDSKKLNEITEKINHGGDEHLKPRFITEDLVVYYYGCSRDTIKNVLPARDKIDILWVYAYGQILKLEGENLTTIRDKLLSVDLGFGVYNDKIITFGGDWYRGDNLFMVSCCSTTAVWLPNVKITEYEIENIEQDEYGREIITLKHKEVKNG